jgi:hypothetical protein
MVSRFASVRAAGRLAVAVPDRTEAMTARRAAVKEMGAARVKGVFDQAT